MCFILGTSSSHNPTADSATASDYSNEDRALDMKVYDFMKATDSDDSNRAKYFLKRANLDVNHAIALYYEEGC